MKITINTNPQTTDLIVGDHLAKCSLWQNGSLGNFEAADAESAKALLAKAEQQLRESGHKKITGPIDGDTWHRYRVVTKSNGRKPFLLEPQNPPEWQSYFEAAAWQPSAHYVSSEVDLATRPKDYSKLASRLPVTVRPLNPSKFQEELRHIYDISITSFQNNHLYSPISFEKFATLYAKVEPLIIPELSLIAEDENRQPVGFIFALPDGTDVVVKTLAVLPERRLAGLGSLLVELVHQTARDLGFTHAIHALQHQDNNVKRISSRHNAKVFREYTLYEKYL